MKARLVRLFPFALALGCFFVTGLVSVALAGPGSGASGPGGGCPESTFDSPGCVTLAQIPGSDGGAISALSYTATGASPQWTCSLGTATCGMLSSINPATASTTVAAVTENFPAGLDADDLAWQVLAGGGGYVAKVDVEGDTQIAGDFTFSDTLTSTTDATLLISGAATDAVTSGTVGVFTLKAQQNITAADLLLDVQDSAGGHAFTVTEGGVTQPAGAFCVPVNQTLRFNASAACSTGPYVYATGASILKLGDGTGAEAWWDAVGFYPGSDNTRALGQGGLRWTTGSFAGNVTLGDLTGDASVRGACTLNGGAPATCTATVTAAAYCTCSNVGTTAAIALTGCAVSLSGTTLTVTSANAANHNVNYHCIL